ncbi:cytohesin-interacting protein [Bombina bombina]|uniref:cytohesin-interacting protein n=1 Tax=Bombina bombina TaxID=8345 RepID=UPI00235A8234|nr:cytohesin-interacting protein [Bombina bombina]
MSKMTSKRHKDQSESKLCYFLQSKSGTYSQTLYKNESEDKSNHNFAMALATLPRGHKQLSMSRSNSLIDSTGMGPRRRLLLIVKQDNEPFGFEIQTYKLQHHNLFALEMCTYVCKVHENSPSSHAGLKIGDMLTNINGINTDGYSHQKTVELIRSSGNYLRLETINGIKIRRSELEAKLLFLKQDFQEKWDELQKILRKEEQIVNGTINEHKIQEYLDVLQSKLFEGPAVSSSFLNKHRFSSGSSCKSRFSSVTDSEDGFCHMSVFDEDSGSEAFSRQSSMEDDCFLIKTNEFSSKKSSQARSRRISVTSNGSDQMSPSWDTLSLTNIFGTLPRKSRRGSIRKNFLKFIPGLHRSVEEEESPV